MPADSAAASRPRIIALEGPIRVGKSTLAQILAQRLNARLLLDQEDNPHLAAFYAGEPGAALRAQMQFLITRYKQWQPLRKSRSSQVVVSDYVFAKDKIFAYLNLSDEELQVYNPYYELFSSAVGAPDLVVYLQASAEVLKQRLLRKNLPSEQRVSDEYLQSVAKAYDHFFFHYQQSDLLVINTNDIDFVRRGRDLDELLARLERPIRGTEYFVPTAP